MPFGLNKFKSSSSGPFDRNQDKNFGKLTSFEGPSRRAAAENPFDTTRKIKRLVKSVLQPRFPLVTLAKGF